MLLFIFYNRKAPCRPPFLHILPSYRPAAPLFLVTNKNLLHKQLTVCDYCDKILSYHK